MKPVGITTTIPVEAVFAAGYMPVDLNNIFITDRQAGKLVEAAERRGFPRSLCSWVKGIYGALIARDDINLVIAVTEGDCSNTVSLLETLKHAGKEVITFAYPYDRDPAMLRCEIEKLAAKLGTTPGDAEKTKEDLLSLRKKLHELDRMTWEDNIVTGGENHIYQVTASDFNGDPVKFEKDLDDFIGAARGRAPFSGIRLGYAGVPPIFSDIYSFLEERGARVIFNEMQRQFTMPSGGGTLVEQYLNYTYPYDMKSRIADIRSEIKKRKIGGLIHYIQSFCHHQIEDIVLRESVDIPVLTMEGDRPGPLDGRSRLRLEAFLETL